MTPMFSSVHPCCSCLFRLFCPILGPLGLIKHKVKGGGANMSDPDVNQNPPCTCIY